MEINHLLKDVINLNEYISATQEVLKKFKSLKVTINIATVLTLKKIRSLEIEYLNKCDENGAACIVFGRLLATPPSKVWGVLAKELIFLLQYWLEAIRKHLINHSTRWWMFLKLILKFIKEIRLKDPTIPNMLVELTAECLFDLATAPRPDVFQRHEILHCFNMVCAESGREIRFAMRTKFGDYFVKIAAQMATSGYLPSQYSSLECLLRWLVPRQEKALRAAAADKWLPRDLCPSTAKTLFLNRNWMNFFQDARDFLNALNEGNGLVTSMICRRLAVGEIVIINGTERQESWLDINTSGKSLSVLLDPRILHVFGVADHRACETLLIEDENTETAMLHREPLGLTISLSTLRAPYIRPSDIDTGDRRQVTIVISSQVDLRTLDGALRNTFGGKYQLLLDLDTDVSQSPQRSYNRNKNEFNSEEDTRFSHPVDVKRRKHSGYIVRTNNTCGLISPSTASTSSLIQLKDRLAALPRYKFDKEPVSVCAQPALSNVSELTEQDDRCIYTTTTVKLQQYGVCHRSFKTPRDQQASAEKKSRSEGEAVKQKSRGGRRLLSPVVSDDNSTSLLLVATVGSTNDTVINDTIERLSKSKDFQEDNIVNLLVQEALQAKPKSREVSDSGINTDEKKSQEESEAIDDTPTEIKEIRSRLPIKKNFTIVSKSTTDDESNTEAIIETPVFVNPTKNIRNDNKPTTIVETKPSFHVKTIEEFFSQHIAENNRGDIVISPSLAKKINETSSETSENFDENYLLMNEDVNTDVEQAIFNDIDIIDCLNDMVDKVCSDFNKCTEYLYKGKVTAGTSETAKDVETKILKTSKQKKPLDIKKPKRNMKPKYKPIKKAKARVASKTKNDEQENTKKMETIIEQKEEDTMLEEINLETDNENLDVVKIQSPKKITATPCAQDTETPLVRRKRKLYSPKDNDIEKEIHEFTEKTSDDVPLCEIKDQITSKTTTTCYKELEKERKKYTRLPRNRKSRNTVLETPSPRTLKINSMFDNLKQTVESSENITFADKNTDMYNFTSDSDNDDFKQKIEIKKRDSSSAHAFTVKKRRNTRRVKESESSYEEENKVKPVKRKKVTKRTNKRNSKAKVPVVDLVEAKTDLIDERMRETVREELNTSILIEHPVNLELENIELVLKELPQMEEIYDSVSLVSKKKTKKVQMNLQDSESNDTLVSKKNTKENQIGLLHDSASNDTLVSTKKNNKRAKKTEVEQIHDNKANDTLVTKKKVNKRKNKNIELLLIKKEKGLAKKDTDKDDDGTISPLPGLVVESMSEYKEDINDSLTTNMLQKFKRIYQEGPDVVNDSVNTQNMLFDVERFDNSAQNRIGVVDEICFVDNNIKENQDTKVEKSKSKNQKIKKEPKTTKHKIQQKSVEQVHEVIETIDIPDINDNQSEMSIATDGITAHGDFEEEPPNPETIKEKFQPRELLDLEQSIGDYFNKLTREIHNSTCKGRKSNKSTEDEEVCTILRNEIEKAKSVISPVVSVKRLSLEDISKWMPSRKTSDTDSPQTSPKTRYQPKQMNKPSANAKNQTKLNENSAETTPKSAFQTKHSKYQTTFESIKLTSPVIPVARMSLEEFDRWLPMPKSSEAGKNVTSSQKDKSSGDLKLVYRTRSKSKLRNITENDPYNTKQNDKPEAKNSVKEIAKPKRAETDKDIEHYDSNSKGKRQLRDKPVKTRKGDLHSLFNKVSDSDLEDPKKCKDVLALKTAQPKTAALQKGELSKESNTISEPSKPNKTLDVNEALKAKTRETKMVVKDSDESPPKNKSARKAKPTISPVKLIENIESNMENKSSDDDEFVLKIRSMFSKTRSNKNYSHRNTSKSKSIESIENSPVRPQKRKSTSPIISERKKPKLANEPQIFDEPKMKVAVLEDVIISESGPSLSSVNDWFRKTEPTGHRHNDTFMSYKDTIQNVMEKLETTLVEINQNTSKKFVNLFVEAQKNLYDQKEEQRALFKQAAADLISEMVKIMDEKFADLDRKSQAMGNNFMEKLKKQAFDMMRDDCNQKRAMVMLLKEDVQAVIDHIDRSTRVDYQ